jgi:hypothetical protein
LTTIKYGGKVASSNGVTDMTLQTVFEKETCGRCGGCGQYSYNQMDGSTCYGCGGKGERLTKRGAVASAFYVQSCEIEASAVQVGDLIKFDGFGRARKLTIREIGRDEQRNQVMILTGYVGGVKTSIHTSGKVRKYWDIETNQAKIAAALEYQATLTKTGKPAKR